MAIHCIRFFFVSLRTFLLDAAINSKDGMCSACAYVCLSVSKCLSKYVIKSLIDIDRVLGSTFHNGWIMAGNEVYESRETRA